MKTFLLNLQQKVTDNLISYRSIMNKDILDFTTYCIGNLSRRLGLSQGEVYRRLMSSGILYGYIIPAYDTLHTFGKEYLMQDLTEFMREKGAIA